MDEHKQDEHSPYYHQPEEESLDLLEMIRNKWVWYLIAGILLLPLLGCDDFDRRLAEQEYRAKVFHACLPEHGQRIVVIREEEAIHFTYIDLSAGRYGRTFPHTEIRVATVEGM